MATAAALSNRPALDFGKLTPNVRYWGEIGLNADIGIGAAFDPGRVKTFFLHQKLHATRAIHADTTV